MYHTVAWWVYSIKPLKTSPIDGGQGWEQPLEWWEFWRARESGDYSKSHQFISDLWFIVGRAGERGQLVKCLPGIWVWSSEQNEFKKPGIWCMHAVPVLGNWRQVDPRDSVASHPGWVSKFWASERMERNSMKHCHPDMTLLLQPQASGLDWVLNFPSCIEEEEIMNPLPFLSN